MTEPVVEPPADRPLDLGVAAARGTGITLAVQGSRTLLQFGSMVVLARLLLPEHFGLVAMVTAVIGIAELIRDFGLSLATVQSARLSVEERTNLFWANLGMGAGCTVLAMASTPLIVLAYGEPRLTPVVLALSSTFLINGFTTQFKAGLARDMRFPAIGASDLAAQIVSIVLAVTLAATGFGLWALVVQQILFALVGAVMCAWLAHWWPSWPQRQVSIRRFLRFGVGIFGTQGISYVTKNIDNVLIGAVYGAAPLGFYSRAYQLLRIPLSQINAPLTQVALPVLRHVQADDAAFTSYLKKSQLVACYLTATLFAVAAGLAEPVVLVLFGRTWLEVAPIFAVLAVGGVFRAISQVSGWAYMARGKPGALFLQRTVTGPLAVVLILAGLPWGPVGVAAGVSVAAFLTWLIALWHAGRAVRVDTLPLITNGARIVALVGAPCGGMAYLGTLVPVPAVVQILLGCVFAAGYVVLAYLVAHSVRADIGLTISFARRALVRRSA